MDEVKLGGAKRKNGHKSNCSCHICENMKNKAKRGGYVEEMEREEEYISGGSKKKNGHRKDCKCPICKNMKNAKKGGDKEEENEVDFDKEETEEETDFSGGKRKKGNGHKSNCKCPICKNMRKGKKGGQEPDIENQMGSTSSESSDETKASEGEYDELDAAERGEHNPAGGTRKHKKWGGKKWGGRKTRRGRRSRRRHSRKHR